MSTMTLVGRIGKEVPGTDGAPSSFKDMGWLIEIQTRDGNPAEIVDYRIRRDDGGFYDVRPGAYANPISFEEPLLGIDLPALSYVNGEGNPIAMPTEKLVGITCLDEHGKPIKDLRFSLTNARDKLKIGVSVDPSSDVLTITDSAGSSTTWHLRRLIRANGQRLLGLVGVFTKEPGDNVQVLELGDMVGFGLTS